MNKTKQNLRLLSPTRLRVLCLSMLTLLSFGLKAQTTVVLAPTSYGTVTTAGVQTASSLTGIEELTSRRGWFKFDLSALSGVTITSATLTYSTATGTVNSGSTVNQLNKATDDLSAITGTTLFSRCAVGGNTTNLFTGAWSGTHPLTLTQTGATTVAFLQGQLSAGYACFSLQRGSTNSYNFAVPSLSITYTGGAACTGTPNPGNTIASAASACPGNTVNLSLQNSTTGSGVTWAWQSADNAAFTVNVAASGTTSSISPTINAAKYYRCSVTCSGNTGVSTPVLVGLNTFLSCYCIPTTTNGCLSGDHVTNVTFTTPGSPINNTTGACLSASYSDYTSTVATAQVSQLNIVPISVSVNNGGTEYAGAWIDYNQNGTFDASEYITLTDADGVAPWVYTGSVTIPLTATVGTTRLRVRSSYAATVAAGSACGVYSYGETEDYYINILATTLCTTTPTPGNTISSAGSGVCSGVPFTLSLQNFTNGTGVTYQWYQNGVAISGANGPSYTTSITAPSTFTCDVDCQGNTTTSNPISMTINGYMTCYCTPTSQYGSYSITNVSFDNINNTTGAPASPYYTNYPTPNPTIAIGSTLPITVNTDSYTQAGVWIDYNQNGTFDASEFTYLGTTSSGSTGSFTSNITIPGTAVAGACKMRVRSEYYFYTLGSGNACSTTTYGETEDYTINLYVPAPCAGTPAPGNTIASIANGCPGATVAYTLQNAVIGTGISYQWYNGGVAVSGATNSFYSTTLGNTASSVYCAVTCANGSTTSSSTAISVPVNSFLLCYCASQATTTADEEIFGVAMTSTTGSVSQTSTCSTTGGAGSVLSQYSNYTGNTPLNAELGSIVNFTINLNACGTGTYFNGTAIFIDYNQNGSFADPGEQVFVEPTTIGTVPGTGRVVTGSYTVPFGATLGTTRMRVINAEGFAGATLTPCLSYGYGETEDYSINLTPSTACSGTPNPGNTISSLGTGVCPGASFTLSLQNTTVGGGVTYQWYQDNVAISGANGITYTTSITSPHTYYCDVDCAGNTGSSNIISLTVNSYIACYCTPTSTYGTSGGFYGFVSNVTFGSISNATSYPAASPYYTDYPTPNPAIAIGTSVPLSVTVSNYSQVAVWIDYNQNGTFDASEYTFIGTSSLTGNATYLTNISIPGTATPGVCKMRIRGEYYGYTMGAGDACTTTTYGETEDYTISLYVPSPCAGTPAPGNTLASIASGCPTAAVTYTLQNAVLGTGISYQWYNGGTAVSGATNSYYTTTLGTTSSAVYCAVTCANGSTTANSATISVPVNPFNLCYCTPTNAGGSCLTNVSINTLNNTTAGCSGGTNYSFQAGTTTLIQGATYPLSVTTDGGAIESVWIDYNQNGSYDASEWTQITTSSTASVATTISITVPVSATLGTTGMRIRSRATGNQNGAADACLAMGSGETEDYNIIIGATSPCSGTPAPGNAVTNNGTTCSGSSATLSLQNATAGSGVTYQWYNAVTNAPISGANGSTYNTGALTATSSYYCAVDCGGNTTNSGSVTVTVLASVPGSSMANPIVVGQAPCVGSPYVDTKTNTTANCFSSNYTGTNAQASPDVWYQFTLAAPAVVNAGHCGSGFDTYIHLLDASGTQLLGNDDYGPLCSTQTAGSITSGTLAAGTYYIVSEGFGSNTGAITTTIYTNNPCSSIVNLKCFIEGYYIGSSTMLPTLANEGVGTSTTNVDEITVTLKDATTFATVATATAMLQTDGTATATFSTAPSGSFYIAVTHRNALETWSATPQTVGTTPLTYDFTTASSKAYTDGSANNMREIEPGVWAFWSGDIFKDGVIDGSDGSALDNDSDAGVFGYFATDLNGDGSIDGSDYPFFNNNADASIYSQHP